MSASKKSRHVRHSQYRVATPKRARQPEASATRDDAAHAATADANELESQSPLALSDDADSTRPVAAVENAAETITDKPTIILTPDQIAALSSSSPPPLAEAPRDSEEGYAYQGTDADLHEHGIATANAEESDYDAPTIVLDVAALMAAPPPPIPDHPAPAFTPRPDVSRAGPAANVPRANPAASIARPDVSWPRPPRSNAPKITPRAAPPAPNLLDDPQEEFARLREQRLARADGQDIATADDPYISDKLRHWWNDIQPGIDRILGRSHRGGTRGARATTYQTSAQLPVVRGRATDEAPAVQRLSSTARQIGTRAQTAAMPAIAKLHSRAERAAQQLVDRIDEHLGGRPPMQHVLLGPGRMIVSFTTSVSIRDAQMVIASVQARALRRLVGYNAYLVLVPPGREAIYAERFHTYREITGVHFGPQRPGNSTTGKLAPSH